jgi:hypothetical protein
MNLIVYFKMLLVAVMNAIKGRVVTVEILAGVHDRHASLKALIPLVSRIPLDEAITMGRQLAIKRNNLLCIRDSVTNRAFLYVVKAILFSDLEKELIALRLQIYGLGFFTRVRRKIYQGNPVANPDYQLQVLRALMKYWAINQCGPINTDPIQMMLREVAAFNEKFDINPPISVGDETSNLFFETWKELAAEHEASIVEAGKAPLPAGYVSRE